MPEVMKIRERILLLTDILIAAIYSDGTMMGEEDSAARQLIADLLITSPDDLPPEVDARIRGFRIMQFDLEEAARDFLSDPPMKKRRLLELVVKMVDADGETDLREDQFVRELAKALKMDESEYEDLVLEIEEVPPAERKRRRRESFTALTTSPASVPPPIPDDA